jgi:NAD-dependent deacetylase sirtuin 4
MKLASESDAILVIGSTLSTFSALRLVDLAYKNNKVIGILNIGETRGDSMTTFKIEKNIS